MIYFIQDSATLNIKIGYTGGGAGERLRALQTGNPSPLVLLGVIEGEQTDERNLHARFASHRVAGEWFRPSPDILVLIAGGIREAKPPRLPELAYKIVSTVAHWDGTFAVRCPQCGCENVHLRLTLVDSDKTALQFWCEQGCNYQFHFWERKGYTYLSLHEMPSDPDESDADLDSADDLHTDSANWQIMWPAIANAIGGILAMQLQSAGLPKFGVGDLIFTFPDKHKRQQEACERPESRRRIAEAIRSLTGDRRSIVIMGEGA